MRNAQLLQPPDQRVVAPLPYPALRGKPLPPQAVLLIRSVPQDMNIPSLPGGAQLHPWDDNYAEPLSLPHGFVHSRHRVMISYGHRRETARFRPSDHLRGSIHSIGSRCMRMQISLDYSH